MASQNFDPIHFPNLKDKIDAKSPLLDALFLFSFLFFTFLFIYFVYTCTHRRHPDGGNSNSTAPPPPGLSPATISSLPISSYGSINKKLSQEAECSICLSMFQEGDKVKVLPLCHHGFHSDCVDEWLKTRPSCPLCRGCVYRDDSLSRELDSGIP